MSKSPAMPTRKIDIDWSEIGFDRYWNNQDPLLSHAMNALSMMFPRGEQEFIDSMRLHLDHPNVTPELREAVKAFTAQESTHRFQHERFNRHFTEKLGYRDYFEQRMSFLDQLAKKLPRRWVKKEVKTFYDAMPPIRRLAMTVCFEHFTAMLTDALLEDGRWIENASPDMKFFWTWHSVEESEHKSVAFDLYQACGGTYLRRILQYTLLSVMFNVDWWLDTYRYLRDDGVVTKWSTIKSFFKYMTPLYFKLFPQWVAFYSPKFHPWNHDNRAALARWEQQYGDRYQVVGQ